MGQLVAFNSALLIYSGLCSEQTRRMVLWTEHSAIPSGRFFSTGVFDLCSIESRRLVQRSLQKFENRLRQDFYVPGRQHLGFCQGA